MKNEEHEVEQVYHPNMQPAPPDSTEPGSLACFMDQARVCGPDCMAYLAQVPEGQSYVGEQWSHCLLLVNAERIGKHTIILVSELVKARVRDAEKARAQPVPTVR